MDYWLVQRLSAAYPNKSKKGFDSRFELDYMGSSEYEFRTPFEALRRMRTKALVVFVHELHSCRGVALLEPEPVYFVGHKSELLDKITAFEKWLENPRSKEATYFPENLTGLDWKEEPIDEYYRRTVAWWSFDCDIAWTLDPEVAKLLHEAFTQQPATTT